MRDEKARKKWMERRLMGSVERLLATECELGGMIQGYLTAIAAWPVTLALIGLSAGVVFFTRCRVMGVVLVVLFMLVAVAAWQFDSYM